MCIIFYRQYFMLKVAVFQLNNKEFLILGELTHKLLKTSYGPFLDSVNGFIFKHYFHILRAYC